MREDSRDIFDLLVDADQRKRNKMREEILRAAGVGEEYFKEGTIEINSRTCEGAECKLCLEVCPTNALYWDQGKVQIERDLCIYCCACVLSCIVDHCIQITRTRKNGEIERFGTPQEVVDAMSRRSAQRRGEAILSMLEERVKTRS